MCLKAQTQMKIHGVYHMTIKKNKYLHMKKLALLSALLFVFCVIVSSCKSREKCPAYTKANTALTIKKSV